MWLTNCRYRDHRVTSQGLIPECHNLKCPLCHQSVIAKQCSECTCKHPDDVLPRPDLQGIETTLPFVEGRDRPVHFALDGSITYAKVVGVWEPPRDIDG